MEAPRSATAPVVITDLDGTLLRPDGTLGLKTVQVVNDFIAAGGLFTYATARSFTSAFRLTGKLNLTLPVITYGGAVIVDPTTGSAREVTPLPAHLVEAVLTATRDSSQPQPILFAMHDGRDRVCWLPERASPFVDGFLGSRLKDPRLLPLTAWSDISAASVFYISVIGHQHALVRLRATLHETLASCHTILTEDIYSPGDYWLELCATTGTKAAAIAALRDEFGADQLICAGDNHNDMPMLAIADIGLAVGNAVAAVKQAADEIIGTNVEEGVAEWIASRLLPPRPNPDQSSRSLDRGHSQ